MSARPILYGGLRPPTSLRENIWMVPSIVMQKLEMLVFFGEVRKKHRAAIKKHMTMVALKIELRIAIRVGGRRANIE